MVTATVACYNQAQFVIEALNSVKAQAYPNLHLVVVDDCSTDNSVEIIRDWLSAYYPESLLIAHQTRMGVCRTASDSLANAKGKYVRPLAADDCWVPGTLTRQIEMMEAASEDVGVLYSDAFQMDERGQVLPGMFIEAHRRFAEPPEGWIFDTLLDGNFIPSASVVIRLRCLEAIGGIDESLMSEDWDLWLRIARKFKFAYFPEPTAKYRVVQSSMTRTRDEEIIHSERRMLVKYLRLGWLEGQKKREAIDAQYIEACRAYKQAEPGRVREAAEAFKNRRCIKHVLLLLSVLVGAPYRRFEELIVVSGRLKRRITSMIGSVRGHLRPS